MKFLHIGDLHLGKRLNGFSLIEDQEHILNEILNIAISEKCDGILIAGDVYDKPIPCVEAVSLFDGFLSTLSSAGIKAFIISGNHDSPERVSFGSQLFDKSGIYISSAFSGELTPVSLCENGLTYDIYMLPFIKPVAVKRFFHDVDITSYTDAVKAALACAPLEKDHVNILLAHQLVTGALRSDSEDISIGGCDNVDALIFSEFDYAALGHIHRPQKAGADFIRYSGSPLKYSFSEADHQKSAALIEFHQKGTPECTLIPLKPLHDLREVRGTFSFLTDKENYSAADRSDYIHAVLTDEEDVIDAAEKLRAIYPNLMKTDYDNLRTRTECVIPETSAENDADPLEAFGEFYVQMNGAPMTDSQEEICRKLIEEIWEEIK